jgi:hypothetical protein
MSSHQVRGVEGPITWHAAIEARDGQRLRLVIANEGQPALLFKSVAGAWDWAATSKLSIPVENPGDEALTLSLRIASGLPFFWFCPPKKGRGGRRRESRANPSLK